MAGIFSDEFWHNCEVFFAGAQPLDFNRIIWYNQARNKAKGKRVSFGGERNVRLAWFEVSGRYRIIIPGGGARQKIFRDMNQKAQPILGGLTSIFGK